MSQDLRRSVRPLEDRSGLLVPWVIGGDLQIGGKQRSRLAANRRFDILNDRAEADDRTDTNGDADEEKEKPVPRSTHFTIGKVYYESHFCGCGMKRDYEINENNERNELI